MNWIYYKYKLIFFIILLNPLSYIQVQGYTKNKIRKLINYTVYWGMIQNSAKDKSKAAEWICKLDSDILDLQERKGLTVGIYEFIPEGANSKNL